ncbi:MAG: hypothetical protein ACREP2_12795 [Rhodanobacteraceae bacterium]
MSAQACHGLDPGAILRANAMYGASPSRSLLLVGAGESWIPGSACDEAAGRPGMTKVGKAAAVQVVLQALS